MADDKPKTKTYEYVGNPGYWSAVSPDKPLFPGDRVQLTAEQAAQVGDDFQIPTTTKTAAAADPKD